MKSNTPTTALLGDVIAAAFDEAARQSRDPTEVSRMAVQAVRELMRRGATPELEPLRRRARSRDLLGLHDA